MEKIKGASYVNWHDSIRNKSQKAQIVKENRFVKINLTLKKLGDWGKVTKHWFDPKLFWTPAKLENVIRLKVKMEKIPKDLAQNEKIVKRIKKCQKIDCYRTWV